jgi:hypothetical protein
MRVVQIREKQPPAEPSLFRETISFFAAAGLLVACYIVFAVAF